MIMLNLENKIFLFLYFLSHGNEMIGMCLGREDMKKAPSFVNYNIASLVIIDPDGAQMMKRLLML